VDNLTHTLVGAALAEAGLKKRTALGAATLMIGANFPDIDVIAVPLGKSFEWRRGATHGFLALVVLPFVLAALMWLWDRHVRQRRSPSAAPADYRQLSVLAGLAILTHPTLDFMNSYGMRWLMPFVDKWFYADGLFIIDLVIIAALILGIVWSRRDRTPVPSRMALAVVAVYILANLGLTSMGRSAVATAFPGKRAMVAPVPANPWRRQVVVDADTAYHLGSFSPTAGLTFRGEGVIQKWEGGRPDVAYDRARASPEAQGFLGWVRFPAFQMIGTGGETVVRIVDVRYCCGGWASVAVRLP
jgi:inner membrane protein